jgi:hypothetical protein
MTINLEQEIVGSSYDPVERVHHYTIERNARRWTVKIPDAHLDQHGQIMGASAAQNQANRRLHVARCLENAMRGPADGE